MADSRICAYTEAAWEAGPPMSVVPVSIAAYKDWPKGSDTKFEFTVTVVRGMVQYEWKTGNILKVVASMGNRGSSVCYRTPYYGRTHTRWLFADMTGRTVDGDPVPVRRPSEALTALSVFCPSDILHAV
jgi:hypothetical protein